LFQLQRLCSHSKSSRVSYGARRLNFLCTRSRTGPYRKPYKSGSHCPTCYFKIHFNIIPPTPWSLLVVSLLYVSQPYIYMHLSYLQCVLHVHSPNLLIFRDVIVLNSIKNYEAAHYALFLDLPILNRVPVDFVEYFKSEKDSRICRRYP
jgi:hypothetical protein